MEVFESLLFTLAAILVVVVFPIMWLIHRRHAAERRERSSRQKKFAQFEHRQLHPDFTAFASRYGCEPPSLLRRLYEDRENVLDASFDVHLSSSQDTYFVAWFEPMDNEHMSIVWRGNEAFYSLANDGCDNQYLIDPKDTDPEVFFYDHELCERKALGVRLSQFLAAKRTR